MNTITLEIKKRETRHEIESLRPQEVDGVRLCVNCNKPIPDGNQKYCSRQCCVEFFAKNNQAGLRKYVLEREHGVCQMCHESISPVFPLPYPAKPQFSKPRPEEHTFPNYTKTNHRIGNCENGSGNFLGDGMSLLTVVGWILSLLTSVGCRVGHLASKQAKNLRTGRPKNQRKYG